MKHTNKLGLLAAVGITMSVACIVVRTERAGATGSYGTYKHDWAQRATTWNEDIHSHHSHGHQYGWLHAAENCTCSSDDSQDDPSDGGTPSQDTSDASDDNNHSPSDCDNTEEDAGEVSGDSDSHSDSDSNSDSDPDSDNNPEDGSGSHDPGNHDEDDTAGEGTESGTGNENGSGSGTDDGSDDPSDPGDSDPDSDSGTENPTDPASLELAVDQQVSVDNGAFKPADTTDDAAEAQLGSEVVWKISVNPVTVSAQETRTVKIAWVPPANVQVVGHEASSGTYDGEMWTVDVANLPAELLIRTTLKEPGSSQAVAKITKISCTTDGVDSFCDFEDTILENNTNPSVISTDTGAAPTPPVSEPAPAPAPAPAVVSTSQTPGATGGVLGARTTARGGEGRRVTYIAGSNGVLGVATGPLANTGSGSRTYMAVLVGMALFTAPLALSFATTKKR